MPSGLKRYQQAQALHYITFTCYHRAPHLSSAAARELFERTLERTRQWYGFYVNAYVVMPEHVHLLISEPERSTLAVALQMLKQIVSRQAHTGGGPPFHAVLGGPPFRRLLAEGGEYEALPVGGPPFRQILGGPPFRPPLPEGGAQSTPAFWQRRYYDFNVWSNEKFEEKVHYIHCNPVRRGLVERPEDWQWSSFRHIATGEESIVEIESQWTARERERLGIFPKVKVRGA